MRVVRQDYPCIDMKRREVTLPGDRLAQEIDAVGAEAAAAIAQVDGEKVSGPGTPCCGGNPA